SHAERGAQGSDPGRDAERDAGALDQRGVRVPRVRHPVLRADQGERMTDLAVRYRRKTTRHEVQAAVPRGAVTRVHVPDEDAKAHLVTALLKARTEPGEELELFGESAAELERPRRKQLLARVGAVAPIVGLLPHLNAWENIALPAAYHGSPPLEQVATLTHQVLAAFGA